VQFVLMIVVTLLNGDGAVTSQAILFPSKEACETAKVGFVKHFNLERPNDSHKLRATADCQPLNGKASNPPK